MFIPFWGDDPVWLRFSDGLDRISIQPSILLRNMWVDMRHMFLGFLWFVFQTFCYLWLCEGVFTGCQSCIESETEGQSSHEYFLSQVAEKEFQTQGRWFLVQGLTQFWGIPSNSAYVYIWFFFVCVCMILGRINCQNRELKRPQYLQFQGLHFCLVLNSIYLKFTKIWFLLFHWPSETKWFCWVMFIPDPENWSDSQIIFIYWYNDIWSIFPMTNKYLLQNPSQRCLSNQQTVNYNLTRKTRKWYPRWVTCHEVLLLQGTLLMQCSERLFGSLMICLSRSPTY